MLKGAAHITGGGLTDNLPRVLPPGCDAVIDPGSWKIPPLFGILQAGGKVPMNEMFQVFNMGIGMAAVVSERHAADALALMKGARRIGRIEPGTGKTRFEMASGA
jgi:phosphoribosylformylglycinamidine cyclo-ligase